VFLYNFPATVGQDFLNESFHRLSKKFLTAIWACNLWQTCTSSPAPRNQIGKRNTRIRWWCHKLCHNSV